MRAPALSAIAFAALTSACASTGAVPRPFPMPHDAPAPAVEPGTVPATVPGTILGTVPGTVSSTVPPSSVRPSFDAYAVTGTALSLRGTPYRNGGSDPNGFDCSGFTQFVFAQHGIALPREVRDQYRLGTSVKPDQLVAGDLLFFTTTDPGASHVAIAIGGDEFVHAPSSTGVVRVERLGSSYWSPRFLGARRVN
jgi:cell wall-associated NlpC family hydrolase